MRQHKKRTFTEKKYMMIGKIKIRKESLIHVKELNQYVSRLSDIIKLPSFSLYNPLLEPKKKKIALNEWPRL